MAHFAAKGVADGKEARRKISAGIPSDGGRSPTQCDNVVALSEGLGVYRRLLYKWRQQLEPTEPDGIAAPDTREFTLTKEICQLKRLLGEKVQEVDFFDGALQKVEARRQNKENAGARASTTKSGK